ncbi:hypothetical protein [Actinokineospora sp.]|uniref:hypothetical protein n=1 Tax=Actinokineospora sp. TaxID=1872133 RepID=UPI003D6AB796
MTTQPSTPRPGTPHPSTHLGCQTFRFLTMRWCKTAAAELIAADLDAAELVDAGIGSLAAFLPGWRTPGAISLIQIDVDHDHAMSTDLDRPIIAVRIVSDSGQGYGSIVIDGWHRVYRALAEDRTTLPALVLSAAAEKAARYPLPDLTMWIS